MKKLYNALKASCLNLRMGHERKKDGELVRFLTFGIALLASFMTAFGAISAKAQTTSFAFTASPTSWVGAGRTEYYTSLGSGWTIISDNFAFETALFNMTGPDEFWNLYLAAPQGGRLTPGLYTGAKRYGFDSSAPGLSLAGNGRGNNTLTGSFEIMEAVYSPTGGIDRFSVNFTQYDEGNPDWWIRGQFRFNATAVAAEPSTGLLALAPLALFAIAPATRGRRRSRDRRAFSGGSGRTRAFPRRNH